MYDHPLKNKQVVITRDEKNADQLANQVISLGGIPILLPLISFKPTTLNKNEQKALHDILQFEWIIFTSVNGVHYFFQQYENLLKKKVDRLPKIAVVGDKTKKAMEEKGFTPSLVPRDFVAESLVHAFHQEDLLKRKILFVKGNLARDTIRVGLESLGATVSEVNAYETYCPTSKQDVQKLLQTKVDVMTFTSPSTINHFVKQAEGLKWKSWLEEVVVCCIGPITENAARSHGIEPTIVPSTYTIEHLFLELVLYYKNKEE
jgi:uroporphyrinogen-III synthase